MHYYATDPDEPHNINYSRFKPSNESDYDSAISYRRFSGRMTKLRWKILSRFCRAHSRRIPVYSDYDCTGQRCGEYFEFEYQQHQVIIRLRVDYDV